MSLPDPLPALLDTYARLRTKYPNQFHLVLRRRRALTSVSQSLHEYGWRLITMFATDERMDEDCRMKIYYLFAPGEKITRQPERQRRVPHGDVFAGSASHGAGGCSG